MQTIYLNGGSLSRLKQCRQSIWMGVVYQDSNNADNAGTSFVILPSVPNYLSDLIGTQILRNLWGICENAKLGFNPGLNKLSNELFFIQNGVVNKKIWWFDQGCSLIFMINFQFQISASRFVIIFVMVCWNWLKFGIQANW
jgi:hypothetical protein